MTDSSQEPTRTAPVHIDDNGKHVWASMCSPSNNKVRAACNYPIQLPGLIIFVHGVNSEGEWYKDAEKHICEGLNNRLNLTSEFQLLENGYSSGISKPREITESGRSPVIRFYWGYSAGKNTNIKYDIPLRNAQGDDYHDLKKYQKLSDSELQAKGPFWMTLPDGSVQEGVTDAAGKTALVQSTLLDGMSFELL
ncbi:hypothetical protein [Rahnella inusitata]|uniref:T6SS effector phospholipase Tle3 domain-containing protein n=1 Tax=Rahnella inusitata TaxID=58169 RepID=UPI001BC83879|nr:hypothetical protein [Rahnella inusitata]QUT14529.1 hypothetical protein I2123_17940 [Rahnella inusitata]